MKKRLAYLDLLRVISVVLVMWGHFVSVGGGATEIPGVINHENVALPLIDASQWRAYVFEIFLIEKFSTQTAILGVCLFFLITGYLMPIMLERYSRRLFLLNRFFRIFPTLLVSVAFLGVFLYFTQGVKFGLFNYLASVTLTYPWLMSASIMGVLWTLVIEVMFYCFASLIGVFTVRRLVFFQATMLVAILLGVLYKDIYYIWLTGYQARYLLLISIGSAFFLAEKENNLLAKIEILLPSVAFSYIGFYLFKFGRVDATTYENIGTHLLAFVIFLGFQYIGKWVERAPKAIEWSSDLVYPFYLLHVAVGFVTMAFVREYWNEPYFMLFSAIVASLFISWLMYYFVEKPVIQFSKNILKRFFADEKTTSCQ